ncbi:MAG TPA: glycosyltransferase, partial [Flavobacteriaceae bacterium]|nr:glycosyltransferase [Flavobacteriaceae bacterium]
LTVQIIEKLNQLGIRSQLHMFGDGPLLPELKTYISENNLEQEVMCYGNQPKEAVKAKLQEAHFNILPSKSEGWPKAVAEGMFFGCIPITTQVSCVGWMVDYGKRGIIIQPELESAVTTITTHLESADLSDMSKQAQAWSQQYTFDRLEADIKKVLEQKF